MASRTFKDFSNFLFVLLFAALTWTYFQPAIHIQISGIAASRWSANDLARSGYHYALKAAAPKKASYNPIRIPTSFIDFLKELFPQKKQQFSLKAYAGIALGVLIPVFFLLAYASLLAGAAAWLVPAFKKRRIFFTAAFLLSVYALAGIVILRAQANALVRTSAEEASRGLFSFITKSFVRQIGVEPGIALLSLPLLAAALWLLSALRKK